MEKLKKLPRKLLLSKEISKEKHQIDVGYQFSAFSFKKTSKIDFINWNWLQISESYTPKTCYQHQQFPSCYNFLCLQHKSEIIHAEMNNFAALYYWISNSFLCTILFALNPLLLNEYVKFSIEQTYFIWEFITRPCRMRQPTLKMQLLLFLFFPFANLVYK